MINVGFEDKVYSASTLAALVNALRREGIPDTRALDGLHLSSRELGSPETRLSANQFFRLYQNALKLSPDRYLAYHVGQKVHVSTYGMYGFAILSSTGFRQAIHFAERYYQLAVPLMDISFHEERGRAFWSFLPAAHPSIDAELARFLDELHVSIGISLHRDLIGPSFVPLEIHFPFPGSRDAKQYQRMVDCPVLFGQSGTRLVLDASILDREYELGNEIAHREAVKLCDKLMKELQLRVGLPGRVRELLLMQKLAPLGCKAVAKHLHMSERTLRRRLREKQTSCRKLAYELRMHMAVKYLRDTELTVEEIAPALGFSEGASFRRAFDRWAKHAPLKFRARARYGTARLGCAA